MIHREFEEKYRKNLDEIQFPKILEGRMKCICCLKERQNAHTLLVEDEQKKNIFLKWRRAEESGLYRRKMIS